MEISYIVFAGIVVCGICALPLALRSFHKIMKEYLKHKRDKEKKLQQEKVDEDKKDLKQVVSSGTLSDLLDAAKQLGDDKKKGKK